MPTCKLETMTQQNRHQWCLSDGIPDSCPAFLAVGYWRQPFRKTLEPFLRVWGPCVNHDALGCGGYENQIKWLQQ